MRTQLNHLHLHVRDQERSTSFYRRTVGMRVAHDLGGLRFLTDGYGFLLALEHSGDVPKMPEWFHFGFWLPDNQAVRCGFDAAQAEGDRILDGYRVRKHGGAVFCVADPDGYAVEIYHDPPSMWGDQPAPTIRP